MLAGVSAYAMARFSGGQLALQVAGLLVFVLVLWFVLRPLIRRLLAANPLREGSLPPNLMAAVICLMFLMGICTYRLGIFAIFGGFAAGLLFHPTVARAMRHIGIGVLAGALFNVFAVTNLSRWIAGGRGGYAYFDLSGIVLGVVGAALVLMARLVDQARAMQAELDEIP